MDNRIYGYARVSTREQNEDRQIEALKNFGVPSENIIIDKCSGKDTERDGYQYLKRQILRNGDILVIKELDRLSRNKNDIKHELEYFKDKGVRIKILDVPTTLTDFPSEQMWVMDMINAILIEVLDNTSRIYLTATPDAVSPGIAYVECTSEADKALSTMTWDTEVKSVHYGYAYYDTRVKIREFDEKNRKNRQNLL